MPTITNKTKMPLKVPLPGGKILRLGPGKTGQITPKAVDHPPVKKLAEAGDVEIEGHDGPRAEGSGGGQQGGISTSGHGTQRGIRQTGDR